ncbi:MAG: adenylate/guanylate cyclase domain-containing protein [Bacteroidales bacterium]
MVLWAIPSYYAYAEDFTARQGVLDASEFSSSESNILTLDGEWEFYPNELLTPQQVRERTPEYYKKLPGLLTEKPWKINQSFDYATYRLRVFNTGLSGQISIKNNEIAGAWRLYLNGKNVLSNGWVSSNPEEEKIHYRPSITTVFFDCDTLDFVLQISGHNHPRSGIYKTFRIGAEHFLQSEHLFHTGFDFFLLGSMLIMVFYHLSMFFVARKEYSSLYFSFFVLLISFRIFATGEEAIFLFFPSMPYPILLKIKYASFYVAPIFFILFLKQIFHKEVNAKLLKIFIYISLGFTLVILLFPPSVFIYTLLPYQLYIIIASGIVIYWLWKALRNQRQGSLVFFIGGLVMFSTLVYDLALHVTGSEGKELFPLGLLVFILCQSYVLSLKYSRILKKNHALLNELDYKNKNLERMVSERTHELITQKDLLLKTNRELEMQKRNMIDQGMMMEEINELLQKEKEKSDHLLLNVLPKAIADELKIQGKSTAHSYPVVTVLFIDFVGFSVFAETLDPNLLLEDLHFYFANFDDVTRKYNLEKIKTIGDAYMCAGGLYENAGAQSVKSTIYAAFEISQFMKDYAEEKNSLNETFLDCRIGIHTGQVIAGVVGKSKFSFDIWGPTVNVAKRMESACEPGKINISEDTYKYIKDDFICSSRGLITVKHEKKVRMYYVDGIRSGK